MYSDPKHTKLQQLPWYSLLTEAEQATLISLTDFKKFKRYDFIYMNEYDTERVFFLIEGGVKIGMTSEDGKEVIKSILHGPAIFAELNLIDSKRQFNYAQVLKTPASIISIPVESFKALMHGNFNLTNYILKLIGERLRQTETRLESMVFKDARARIVEFLRENALKRGKQIGFETLFKHSLTQQDIANITGTSRQTVTSVLNELRKDNLIYFNRKSFLIRNLSTLA